MPTFNTVVKANQIIFVSTVSIPQALSTPSPEGRNHKTLFDTGAQCSLISPKVVSELQLVTIGDASITPVHGKAVPTRRYRVRLDIPVASMRSLPGGRAEPFTDVRGMELEVAELPYLPDDYDVLMGMDFIAPWHITIQGGQFILSI